MSNENKEQSEKLLQLVRDIVQHDEELREQFQVGNKFRFIRDRLQALLAHVEEKLTIMQKEREQKVNVASEDEVLVYVYLFNAHGLVFKSWQKMLNPTVFYEYSINRPIYLEKSQIEAFIRSKTNKAQNGYLTIAVKKTHIIKPEEEMKDAIGNLLIKVKEGSLHINRLISFTHNAQDYVLDDNNEIVKKESNG